MKFTHTIRTRYSETGQDGIIHHSSFVVYLEAARMEFLKTLGCDINDLEHKKIFCPVVDLSLKYLKPLHSLEDIVVEVRLESFSKVRFSLSYRILLQDTCVATASVSHCFINATTFKPIPILPELLAQFQKLPL